MRSLCTGAAADWRVVEADVAAATAFAALRQAIAASLNHRTARLVAARATDAAAVLRVLALALTAREIALAAGNAVPGATATAKAVGQHAAKVLQCAASDFIVAAAMNLAAALGFFEFDRAARQHAPVRAGRRTRRQRTGLDTLDRIRERRGGR